MASVINGIFFSNFFPSSYALRYRHSRSACFGKNRTKRNNLYTQRLVLANFCHLMQNNSRHPANDPVMLFRILKKNLHRWFASFCKFNVQQTSVYYIWCSWPYTYRKDFAANFKSLLVYPFTMFFSLLYGMRVSNCIKVSLLGRKRIACTGAKSISTQKQWLFWEHVWFCVRVYYSEDIYNMHNVLLCYVHKIYVFYLLYIVYVILYCIYS